MNAAAQMLVGTRDFQCFCKAGSDVKTTVCDLYEARWDHLDGEAWCFTISANRFLRNMVRAVVGTLVEVGRGRLSLQRLEEVSMPAHALFLWDVEYDGLEPQENGVLAK